MAGTSQLPNMRITTQGQPRSESKYQRSIRNLILPDKTSLSEVPRNARQDMKARYHWVLTETYQHRELA